MTITDSGYMMDNGVSCLPCTPEDEKRIVTELTNKAEDNLREGNIYYVISNRWFTSWRKYTGYGNAVYPAEDQSNYLEDVILSDISLRPGPIDNSDIVLDSSDGDDLQLPMSLEESCDYVLAPQEVWEKLYEWYKGGPALPRKLISQGNGERMFSVEVFPVSLKLIDSRDGSLSTIRLSKKASIHELYERVCSISGIEKEKARIWDYFNRQKHSILDVSMQTLEEANLQMDQDILLEVLDDGFRPSDFGMDSTGNELALVTVEPSRSSVTIAGGPTLSNGYSAGHSSNYYQGSTLSSASMDIDDANGILSIASNGEKGGLAGLQNLGNTCFMNSALQCLVHTPPLVKYFLQNYTEDINTENPLGMHGELALAFGELLRKLWSSGRTPIAPRAFKGKLARFAPQFSGYNQHDSQELLAFLLDGLHEDLNRVKQKPYIESKDSDGRPDEEVAQECWKNHTARNDSLIVDVCQGQYKSTLVCPDCSKVSITFDPFMYLSLPLPSTATRMMTVMVFYSDGNGVPMPFTVKVLKHGCCKDLLQALGAECCLKSDESLLLAEVYENKIYKYYESLSEPLSSIKDDEHIVAYRFPKRCAGFTRLQIVHREKNTPNNTLKIGERKLLGSPLVTYLGETPIRGADIYTTVSKMLTPLKRKTFLSPLKTDSYEENGSPYEVVDESENSYNNESKSNKESIEAGETSNGELLSQLYLTDDRLSDCKPVDKDIFVRSSQSVTVVMDWSEREHELYDTSYLKDLPVVFKTEFTVKKTRQEAISLFSCLEAFLKEEPLGPDDMWYCPSCKAHRQATKKLDLWRLPDILVFHLKRFSYSRYLKNKLDTFVNFPIHNLDLSKYVKSNKSYPQSHVYELYAISNHYGGLGGGHYSAYANLIDENRWYHFDDSHVSPVSEADIKTAAAYVLFYKRVTGQPKKEVEESSQRDISC